MRTGKALIIRWSPRSIGGSTGQTDNPSWRQVDPNQSDLELPDELLSISTTANKYNEAVKAVQGKQGLLGKVSRFQSLSQRANKSFPDALSPIEPDVEAIRLEDQSESQPAVSHKEHDEP